MRSFELKKQKSKPGDVVQRFGDWKKGEPAVLIAMGKWEKLGRPESVTLTVGAEKTEWHVV